MVLRRPVPQLWGLALQILSVLVILLVWWALTLGPPEERVLSPLTLPSPGEVVGQIKSLWFDAALTRSTGWSLRRILFGFGLAALVGIPVGILAGCFRGVESVLKPVTL